MITAHWTTITVIAVLAAAMVLAGIIGRPSGGLFYFSPLLGCSVFMAGAILALGLLLAHAWGWI